MTKTHRCLRLLTLLALFANEAGAQTAVYKYVDEKGQVVYTDQPPTDKDGKVETLEIEPSNLSAPPPMAILRKANHREQQGRHSRLPNNHHAAHRWRDHSLWAR